MCGIDFLLWFVLFQFLKKNLDQVRSEFSSVRFKKTWFSSCNSWIFNLQQIFWRQWM